MLDMGEPVQHRRRGAAADRARTAARSPIEYTGLRAGEKLHEELFGDGEPRHVRPEHPLISHVPVPRVAQHEIERLAQGLTPADTVSALRELCDSEPATDQVRAS